MDGVSPPSFVLIQVKWLKWLKWLVYFQPGVLLIISLPSQHVNYNSFSSPLQNEDQGGALKLIPIQKYEVIFWIP